MKDFCAVHTHSLFCDGKNSLAEMAQAAYEAGAVSFGASGHSHTPLPEDAGMVLPADMTEYRREVLRIREAYAGKMDVLLGLEWDNCADVSPEGFDYWIGSVHRLKGPDGQYYTVDWTAEILAACRDEAFDGDGLTMAECYYAEMQRVAGMKPTILGHFDLITKFQEQLPLFDETSPRYHAAALAALHAADPDASYLEINTGAVFRKVRMTPYPAPFLLREWREMGGQVIVTADAHSTAGIVCAYEEAAEIAKAAGYTESVLLTREGPVTCPLS